LANPASETTAASTIRPPRVMGFRDLVLFYVVTGVSLRWIAAAASIGPSSVLIWIGAWLFLYLPLAFCVIELSSRYPAEGGLYVWTKKAFGEGSGFLAGWMYWTSNLPYYPTVLIFAASNLLFLRPEWQRYSHSTTYFTVFSVLVLAGLTLINLVGLKVAKWSYNAGALAMWIPAGMVVAMGAIAWGHFGSATSFRPANLTPSGQPRDIIFWNTFIFAFIGCEASSIMAEEIKDPRRNIPRGLLLAGLTIAACYILGTIGILLVQPASETSNLDGLVQAIERTSGHLGLSGLHQTAAALIAVSNIGAAAAYLAVASRLPFVAGIDGYLPRGFGKLHPRWRTPYISVLVQGIIGIVFVFLGQAGTSVKGAYNVLVNISVITALIPFLFLFAAVIRVQNDPVGPDVTRIPGGKRVARVVACIGFLTTLFATVLSLFPSPDDPHIILAAAKILGSTVALVGLGIVVYWLGKSRATRLTRSPQPSR
jgi:glutamate:GABA antiporter